MKRRVILLKFLYILFALMPLLYVSASASDMSDDFVISISFSGTGVTVDIPDGINDVSYSVKGAHVSIMSQTTSREYTYKVTGSTNDGSLTIGGGYKLTLELGGAVITNPSGPAIAIECDKRIAVEVDEGSVNRLSDGPGGSHKGTLYFTGHPEFAGGGTLQVSGHTKHAIYAREYLAIKGSALKLDILSASGDGIHCGRGKEGNSNNYFLMEAGELTMTDVSGDCIDADDYGVVRVTGGSMNLTVGGYDVVGLKGDSMVDVSGGTIVISVTGTESSGIRAGSLVQIRGGNLNIDVSGDGSKGIKGKRYESGTVVNGGNVSISGGVTEIRTSGGTSTTSIDEPKCMGISVDNDLNHTGGEVSILAFGGSSYTYNVKGIESTTNTFYSLYVPWDYDPDYGKRTMTAYVFLRLNSVDVPVRDFTIGAFVDGICCGIGVPVTENDSNYCRMVIRSDATYGTPMEFRVFSPTNNIVYQCSQTPNFKQGTVLKSPDDPYKLTATYTPSTVFINELMQSNIDCLMESKDFPDSWVELYNPTDDELSLSGYRVSLTDDFSTAYELPSTSVISSKGYLLIYCDEESKNYHTNFKLESTSAGHFYLFDVDGNIVDHVSYGKMPVPNVAYGRKTNGSQQWHYEITASPGAKNSSRGATVVLPEPIFSQSGGLFTEPVTVRVRRPKVSLPTNTNMYITFDGSEPTRESTCVNDTTLTISESTVIRAKLISNNGLSPLSTVHSYIFHPRAVTMPIISIAIDSTYLYSDDIGLLTGDVSDANANYKQEWRRPLNIEYFGGVGEEAMFNQPGETALGGGSSRKHKQKSMKFYAKKRFGPKRFYGAMWPNKPEMVAVKSFTMRNGGNNCQRARINDGLIHRLFGDHYDNFDYQSYRPALLYINGKYAGEFGLRERSNKDNVESNYNGLEDIEMGTQRTYISYDPVNNPFFVKFRNYYEFSTPTYSRMSVLMDVDNFMKNLVAEIYSGNYDWPHNNISMWRPRSEGGKWRWILKDCECNGVIGSDFNSIRYILGDVEEGTTEYDRLYRDSYYIRCHPLYIKMLGFPEFLDLFIDNITVAMGDFLKPSICNDYITVAHDEIVEEAIETFKTYALEITPAGFESWIRRLRTFHNNRPMHLYNYIAEYYNLGTVIPMTISRDGYAVSMNEIGLTEGDFDGAYYSDRELRLSCTGVVDGDKIQDLDDDEDDITWTMVVTHSDESSTEYEFEGKEITLTLSDFPDCVSVAFSVSRGSLADHQAITFTLERGWNWLSHPLSEPVPMSIFRNDVTRIVGQTNECYKISGKGLVGTLTDMLPTEMYKFLTWRDASIDYEGELCSDNMLVPLRSGWNWISYPRTFVTPLSTAFANFHCEEGDKIVGQDGFATYNGTKWNGSLTSLEPGKGYKYLSVNPKSIRFPSMSTGVKLRRSNRHSNLFDAYGIDKHAYPNVMGLIANVVDSEGVELTSDLAILAYSGNECVGYGRLVDGLAFVTIYGNGGEDLRFVVMNEEECYMSDAHEHIDFVSDVVGSMSSPFILTVDGASTTLTEMPSDGRRPLSGPSIDGIYTADGVYVGKELKEGMKGIYLIRYKDGGCLKIKV